MAISDILTGLTLTSTTSSSSTSSSTSSTCSSSNNTTIHAPDGLTLEMVLSDLTSPPFSYQDFSAYLKTTYCNENLLFYEAVTDYTSRCSSYFGPFLADCNDAVLLADNITLFDFRWENRALLNTREQIWFDNLRSKFELILQDFVLRDAPQEINIPYEVRHQLLQAYQVDQSFHPNLLNGACSAVIELLRISAFIPFATDPARVPIAQPVKKKKSFMNKKDKQLTLDQIPPPLPPIPTTTTTLNEATVVPTPTTSTSFLKRIITTSFTKLKSSSSSSATVIEQPLATPPMSPPAAVKNWRHQMSLIPEQQQHFINGKPVVAPNTPTSATFSSFGSDDTSLATTRKSSYSRATEMICVPTSSSSSSSSTSSKPCSSNTN